MTVPPRRNSLQMWDDWVEPPPPKASVDAEHLQKIRDVRVTAHGETWVLALDGAGDLTMERLVATSRADMLTEVFGRRLVVQGSGVE